MFILPPKYVKAKDALRPMDERVVIREEVERKYEVVKFSGVAPEEVVAEKVEKLVYGGESFYSCAQGRGVNSIFYSLGFVWRVMGIFVLSRHI
ncbi:hypothetical protein CASFOL_027832 [Castilleja foliolosa]|uniref:Uncharacterized protein n=1 Tax=Castilleja foliolosa TaxID=1961234 RepID=A0ABD3CHI8_9LAMI